MINLFFFSNSASPDDRHSSSSQRQALLKETSIVGFVMANIIPDDQNSAARVLNAYYLELGYLEFLIAQLHATCLDQERVAAISWFLVKLSISAKGQNRFSDNEPLCLHIQEPDIIGNQNGVCVTELTFELEPEDLTSMSNLFWKRSLRN
uniref:Uncharacterized protein n=1 Tax=Salix viminalis TaxID=40686 RepID=A0A6N2K075_SALVM